MRPPFSQTQLKPSPLLRSLTVALRSTLRNPRHLRMYSVSRLSEENLLQEEKSESYQDFLNYRINGDRKVRTYVLLGFQLTFFLVSCSIFLASSYRTRSPRCECTDHMPMYSPALESVQGTGHMHRFDGSFATPNAFKGPPSPEIDAAWANITYKNGSEPCLRQILVHRLITLGGVINISSETLHAVNASADYSVELAPEIGGGYMASVEVLHQLHCLNMLRQATYEDYYRDKAEPWQDSPQTLRYHLGRNPRPYVGSGRR